MQKFNETKQSEETDAEKLSTPPKSAEPVSENTDKKEEPPVNSRESPVGESQRDGQNTATPTATDNSTYWCFVLYQTRESGLKKQGVAELCSTNFEVFRNRVECSLECFVID